MTIPNTLRAAPAFSLHRENVTTPDAAVPNSRREGVNTADFPRTVVEAQAVNCEAVLVFLLWNDIFGDFVPLTPEVRFGPGRTSRVVATDGRMLFVQVKSLTPTGPTPRVDVAVAGLITDGPSERDRVTLSDVTFTGDVQVNLDHDNDDVLVVAADENGAHRPVQSDARGRLVTRSLLADRYDYFAGTSDIADSPVLIDLEAGRIGGPASEVSVEVSKDAGLRLNDPDAPEIPVSGATLPTDPAELDGFEVKKLFLVIHSDQTQYRIFAAGRPQTT